MASRRSRTGSARARVAPGALTATAPPVVPDRRAGADFDAAVADPEQDILVRPLEELDLRAGVALVEAGEDRRDELRREAGQAADAEVARVVAGDLSRLLTDRLGVGKYAARVLAMWTPTLVSETAPRRRVSSFKPSSSSRLATARLTPGWLIESRWLASEKPPVSATASRTLSCASVTVADHCSRPARASRVVGRGSPKMRVPACSHSRPSRRRDVRVALLTRPTTSSLDAL